MDVVGKVYQIGLSSLFTSVLYPRRIMVNFAELKAARDRRKVQSSFTDNPNSLEDGAKADGRAPNADVKPTLVDSSDATKITPDILEQPSFPSEQPRKTENEVDLSIYHSLPADLEVRWTETRGRGIWSREKRRRGLWFFPAFFPFLTI